ncbi:MAG: polysaccharide biosynthesis C-terminal domain-containing protein [Ruminiclostridium sp.]|nr:polysaccharide biosynthesis C-terminal domain-containing protein [Ruminiclostridium sp.]
MAKSFIKNTAVMFIAMIIVKIMGAVFKIPLGNILGGDGMGYFSTAFSIFTPVLAFTASGIPMVVTQVTAQKASRGEYGAVSDFRRCALIVGTGAGVLGTAVIFIAALPFANFIANTPEALPAMLIIAPSALFCSVTAVYRGYYEGLSDMTPTAVSQIVEAVVKAGAGIVLSYWAYGYFSHELCSEEKALPYAAAAAILGVTLSEFCGMLYMLVYSRRHRIKTEKRPMTDTAETIKEIVTQALPVAVGAVIGNLISFTDLLTISNCINLSYSFFPDQLAGGIVSLQGTTAADDPGNFLYGSYSGLIMSVYMLTATIPMLIPRCSQPRLICTIELNKNDNLHAIKRDISVILKGTMLISVPVSVFVAVMAEPVLKILYPVRELEAQAGIIPLQILSIGGIFASFAGALMNIFQGYGDFRTPVRITLVTGLIKFVLNVGLILIPGVNICGAAMATAVSQLFCVFYTLTVIKKRFGIAVSFVKESFPMLVSGCISGIAAFYCHNIFVTSMPSLLSVLLSCLTGCVLYLLILYIADSGELSRVINSIRSKKCGGDL